MEQELITSLDQFYNFKVKKCIAGPRQVVAQTYIVEDFSGKQYFCKLIDNPLLIPGIIQTLPVVEQMYLHGIDKICYPIKGNKGLYFYLRNTLVVVFNYIAVNQGVNYDLYLLGSMIAKVHAITDKISIQAPIEKFEFPNYSYFSKTFEETLISESIDDITQQFKKLLQSHETEIRKYVAELMHITDACKKQQPDLVLTHGDIITNVLVKAPNDVYIIDWDEMRLAPAERDLWRKDENAEFMNGYKSVRPNFTMNKDLRRYCMLQYYFDRMNIYFVEILNPNATNEYRLNRLQRFASGNLAGSNQAKFESQAP